MEEDIFEREIQVKTITKTKVSLTNIATMSILALSGVAGITSFSVMIASTYTPTVDNSPIYTIAIESTSTITPSIGDTFDLSGFEDLSFTTSTPTSTSTNTPPTIKVLSGSNEISSVKTSQRQSVFLQVVAEDIDGDITELTVRDSDGVLLEPAVENQITSFFFNPNARDPGTASGSFSYFTLWHQEPVGVHTFTVTADDGNGGISTKKFSVRIFPLTGGGCFITPVKPPSSTIPYTTLLLLTPLLIPYVMRKRFLNHDRMSTS